MGRVAFQLLDHPMDSKLRITLDTEINMIGHDLHFHDVCLELVRLGAEQFFQPPINPVDQHFPSIFRAEHDVVFTVKRDIMIAF